MTKRYREDMLMIIQYFLVFGAGTSIFILAIGSVFIVLSYIAQYIGVV